MILVRSIELPSGPDGAPKRRWKCGDIICLTLSVRSDPGDHQITCALPDHLDCTFENGNIEVYKNYTQTNLIEEGIQVCFSVKYANPTHEIVRISLWGDDEKNRQKVVTIELTCD